MQSGIVAIGRYLPLLRLGRKAAAKELAWTGLGMARAGLRTVADWDEMHETTFPKPVFSGDTIRTENTVLEMRESKSRPTQGIVKMEHLGFNQRDKIVCRTSRSALMLKKPA